MNALEWKQCYRLQGAPLANQPYFTFTLFCLALPTSQLPSRNSCRQTGCTPIECRKNGLIESYQPAPRWFFCFKKTSTYLTYNSIYCLQHLND